MNHEKGTFMWAVEQMKPKDIIQREHWKRFDGTFGLEWNAYDLYLRFTNNRDGIDRLTKQDVMANDWIILKYEEPKQTLWDKRVTDTVLCGPNVKVCFEKDVKEALNELLDYIDSSFNAPEIRKNAIRIMGKELVENERTR